MTLLIISELIKEENKGSISPDDLVDAILNKLKSYPEVSFKMTDSQDELIFIYRNNNLYYLNEVDYDAPIEERANEAEVKDLIKSYLI